MTTILLFLGIVVTVSLLFALRSMREDHLFSIGHRLELSMWFILTLSFLAEKNESWASTPSIEIPFIFEVVLAGLMIARIFASTSYILGNPKKAEMCLRLQKRSKINTRKKSESKHGSIVT